MSIKNKFESNFVGIISAVITALIVGFVHLTNENNLKTTLLNQRIDQFDSNFKSIYIDLKELDQRISDIDRSVWTAADQKEFARTNIEILKSLQESIDDDMRKIILLQAQYEKANERLKEHAAKLEMLSRM